MKVEFQACQKMGLCVDFGCGSAVVEDGLPGVKVVV